MEMGTQTFTSSGAARTKTLVRVGCGCGGTSSRSLGPSLVGAGQGMCLLGLHSRDLQGPPVVNPDTHLFEPRHSPIQEQLVSRLW